MYSYCCYSYYYMYYDSHALEGGSLDFRFLKNGEEDQVIM